MPPLPEGQYLLWYRGEAVHHIDWGGDPHNKAIAENEGDQVRLSPRTSFDRWREIVGNRSQTWLPHELAAAAELRRHLLDALYARQRSFVRAAETLQRSLLSRPARQREMQTAVRYEPAAREAHVGGDWFDVFTQPDGSTMLVIGDVVGHDLAAAAVMTQLRGLLRGIAYDSADGPAHILARLDAAIAGLGLDALATVLLVRLTSAAHGGRTMTWTSAGHLPPLVVGADGTPQTLAVRRPELMLGVLPSTQRTDAEARLPSGSTLLLFTDGLVEHRNQLFDLGVERLLTALVELHAAPIDDICAGLLDRLVPDGADDDIALVAIRPAP